MGQDPEVSYGAIFEDQACAVGVLADTTGSR